MYVWFDGTGPLLREPNSYSTEIYNPVHSACHVNKIDVISLIITL